MLCKDCKVIHSEYLGTQHRLLVMDVVIKNSNWKKRSVIDHRVRWWDLTTENTIILAEKIEAEGSWKQAKNADKIWETMAECIRMLAKEGLGISKGGEGRVTGGWWWNKEVKERVKEKKDAYSVLIGSRSGEEK